jgi:hypothetical protein
MKPRRLHSDTIFSICRFSLGSAIGTDSFRQLQNEINLEGGEVVVGGNAVHHGIAKARMAQRNPEPKERRATRRIVRPARCSEQPCRDCVDFTQVA